MKTNKVYRVVIILFLGVFLFIDQSIASKKVWLGGSSSDWNDSLNWSPALVPDIDDDIVIEVLPGFFNPVIDNQTITVKDIVIESGSLSVRSDSGLGRLICNAIYIPSGQSLVNQGHIMINYSDSIGVEDEYIWWEAIRLEGSFLNQVSESNQVNPAQTGIVVTNNSYDDHVAILLNEAGSSLSNEGRITITGSPTIGILMEDDAAFDNQGTVVIIETTKSGIVLTQDAVFTNFGSIIIDNIKEYGIYIDGDGMGSLFDNEDFGSITIGPTSIANNTDAGIKLEEGAFVNKGDIDIDNIEFNAIEVEDAIFTNEFGIIDIGENVSLPNCNGISLGLDSELINQGFIDIINIDGGNGVECDHCKITIFQNGNLFIESINPTKKAEYGMNLINANVVNTGLILVSDIQSRGMNVSNTQFQNSGGGTLIINGIEEDAGLLLFESTFLNIENAQIDIESTGGSGLSCQSCTLLNDDNAEIIVNWTGDAALDIWGNGVEFENKGSAKIILCEDGPAGQDPVSTSPYALKYDGDGHNLINSECGELYFYQEIKIGPISNSSLTNESLIVMDMGSESMSDIPIENTGVINYRQENEVSNLNNLGIIVRPMALTDCSILDALEIDSTSSNSISSIWYRNENMTSVAGNYSQTTNEFTPINLNPNAPMDVYFEVTINSCVLSLSAILEYANFKNSTYKWAGRTSSEWNDPCNWDSWKVPVANKKVEIIEATHDPELTSSAKVKELTVENNGHLTIAEEGELILENGSGSHVIVLEGGEVNNYGVLALLGNGTIGYGMNVQGIFNNYDSIAISQYQFGGLFISGTMNMFSGQVDLFSNDGYNLHIDESGLLELEPETKFRSEYFGAAGADDVSLINDGTLYNKGSFESSYNFVTPTIPTIDNGGTITNEGEFWAHAQSYDDTAMINSGIITNTGTFRLVSTQDESPFSLSNDGTLTNTSNGVFEIIGFEKTFCLPGSILINRGSFNHLKMEE